MPAAKLNLDIEQGATWGRTLTIKDTDTCLPISLSGYTFRGQLRESYDATAFTSFTFVIVDSSGGVVSMTLAASTSSGMVAGGYVYDVEMVRPDAVVVRLLQGKAKVTPEVTK